MMSLLSIRMPMIVAAVATAAMLASCGGGGGGGGDGDLSDEEAAGKAASNGAKVLLGALTGSTGGKEFLAVFAPECREGVSASDIDGVLALIKVFAPQLASAKIDEVDFGGFSYEKTSEGIEVTPKDPDSARVKVKGKWQDADEYFSSLGGDAGGTSDIVDSLLMVKRDGKWYIGDCSDLQDFKGGLGGGSSSPSSSSGSASAAVTVTIGGRATATVPTGPGSSRTSPLRLGQSGKVESTWELTVLKVNRDAWPVIQAFSRFNDAPAATEKMLMVTVRAKNVKTDQKPENIDTFSFRVVGSRNQLYDPFDAKRDCGSIPDDLDADLFPGGSAEGNVCFKVPADETGFVLVWEEFFGDTLTYFALE